LWSARSLLYEAAVESVISHAPSARETRAPYKFLVADACRDDRDALTGVLLSLGPQRVIHACTAKEFEQVFEAEGPYDLVLCRALLGNRSGLQVLANVRSGGSRASFIVYSHLQGTWLRVFVSDIENAVMSSRVVSLEGLANLAGGLLEMQRRN
jgi:hypothetical protein